MFGFPGNPIFLELDIVHIFDGFSNGTRLFFCGRLGRAPLDRGVIQQLPGRLVDFRAQIAIPALQRPDGNGGHQHDIGLLPLRRGYLAQFVEIFLRRLRTGFLPLLCALRHSKPHGRLADRFTHGDGETVP
ncbi:MAG: hypothetical protein BWY31_04662 [Lentisphaerae bacterium ADurb.Bin242]|nr:MAG: hypothetical protein BWY31_04662 [Lentisphaerae bacterium ADurb.Bin242]